jgi:hypothetical protein
VSYAAAPAAITTYAALTGATSTRRQPRHMQIRHCTDGRHRHSVHESGASCRFTCSGAYGKYIAIRSSACDDHSDDSGAGGSYRQQHYMHTQYGTALTGAIATRLHESGASCRVICNSSNSPLTHLQWRWRQLYAATPQRPPHLQGCLRQLDSNSSHRHPLQCKL